MKRKDRFAAFYLIFVDVGNMPHSQFNSQLNLMEMNNTICVADIIKINNVTHYHFNLE